MKISRKALYAAFLGDTLFRKEHDVPLGYKENTFSQAVRSVLEPSAAFATNLDDQIAGALPAPVDSQYNGHRAWQFKTWQVHDWLKYQYPVLTVDESGLEEQQQHQLNNRMKDVLEDLEEDEMSN